MQNPLLDCKIISITFFIAFIMLVHVGAEAIGILVELGFTALYHISGHMEYSYPNHTVTFFFCEWL